jgi:hypothetical protein
MSLGPPDASTYALGAALDEPILTDIDSGADQLLSTAVADGLSDPFGTAQGGWISGPQDVDPFTCASSTADPFVGSDVNSYTNAAADDANPNAYAGGQNVEPFGGAQDSVAAADGSGAATAATASPILAFGVEASAVDNAGSTWVGYVYDSNGNVIAAQFQDSQGTISYYWFDNLDSPPPAAVSHYFPPMDFPGPTVQPAPQVSVTPAPTPSPTPPPAPSLAPANPVPGAAAPASQPTLPPDQPTQPPTQQSGPPTPPAPTPQPPSPAGPGAVPFDPMADSPFAKWLLYGNDTPVRDFLTNDSHLQVAQNVAAGVAIGAATVATGGMLLEAAPAIGEVVFEGSIQMATRLPTLTSAAADLGNALTWTTVPRVAMGVGAAAFARAAADELPALGQEIGTAAPELTEGLAPTGPSFEGLIDLSEFENDPEIIDRLSRAREFDIGGYQSLTGRGAFGRIGDRLDSDEALQNAYIRLVKDVERVSEITRDNPAIALRPELHRLIQNLRTSQMQGLTPNEVLQYHLQQMRYFTPDYVLQTLERESSQYIDETF